MTEGLSFSNTHEELAYLRSKVLEAEKELERFGLHKDRPEVIRESIQKFEQSAPTPEVKMAQAHEEAQMLMEKHREVELEDMMRITEDKGIVYTLKVVEKLKGWRLEDDFHDFLISLVAQGLPVRGIKEKGPIYKALHMKLFEVVLPKGHEKEHKALGELIKSMEQLYAGFLSVGMTRSGESDYMAFEIANPEGSEDTRMFVSVPEDKTELFERHLLSIFPNARIIPRERDYNIFNELGAAYGATARLASTPAYSLKTFESFGEDPLNVILSGFSKIPKQGAGAALQIIFHPAGTMYTDRYLKAVKDIQNGADPKEVLRDTTFSGEFKKAIGHLLTGSKEKKEEQKPDEKIIEAIGRKIDTPIVETNIRLVASAETNAEAKHILENLQSAFNQFENPGFNTLEWENIRAHKESDFYRAFTFRLFRANENLPLSLKELSTILHFHTQALIQNTPLKQSLSKSAPAPSPMMENGTLLGVNRFQGGERKVYISSEDRLRHFYVIGQTGTGKSTLLKNMIIEDIHKGEGVCMIDPHGSDIMDVLANIPPERAGDVIYFDPSDTDRPLGLNILEYNRNRPEEKTFVVNELFSIFQKLYGKVPESMGPMFEQYFRNSALLAIDDPDSNATLLDVSRILSNKEYRKEKLAKTSNPILIQFWTEIAEKAGGEAALANIVPYITSKFDVFLANDIMRPIIASSKTSFDMREVMDDKKILLVNLSKGRLGDINANLIGLILVGKILMAALSRVDSIGRDLPPFYLYLDEFQNITTNSIATILSEARKYKLSLTLAHQFIAQLEEEIKNAVFGNVGSISAFRVGADDAKYLESQFAPVFTADDLMNVDNRKAFVKMLVQGRPAAPFDIETLPSPEGDRATAQMIINMSRVEYGRPRREAEAEIQEKYMKKPDTASVSGPGV